MKEKIIEYLIAAVLIGAFIYGLAAFVAWELSPGKWLEFGRIVVGFLFAVATVFYVLNKQKIL